MCAKADALRARANGNDTFCGGELFQCYVLDGSATGNFLKNHKEG